MTHPAPNSELTGDQGSSLRDTHRAADGSVVAPWKDIPAGQFAPWMTPGQRPAYEDAPFRHWVMVEGFCEHHGSTWHRSQVGEAVIRRDSDEDAYQGYRRSDIAEIERRGDMDPGTGIVTFWIPWGNFPPIPTDRPTAAVETDSVGILRQQNEPMTDPKPDVAGARERLEGYLEGELHLLQDADLRLILSAYDRQADEIQRQGEDNERLLGALESIADDDEPEPGNRNTNDLLARMYWEIATKATRARQGGPDHG